MPTLLKKKKNQPEIYLTAADCMPKNKEAQTLLQQRADQIAIRPDQKQESKDTTAYIGFRIGAKERYGISYQYAKEVMHQMSITKLPTAPNFIAGVINYRGTLIAVLDLKKFFHTQLSDYDKESYIVIVTGKGMTIGILADSIEGSNAYDSVSLDAALTSEALIKPEYIIGLHQGRTAIINIETVMVDIQSQIKQAMA